MKFYINIDKKYFFILLGVLVLGIGGIFVYGYGTTNPVAFGHSSGEVDVVIGGTTTKTLQQAIDAGDLGGASQQTIRWDKWVEGKCPDQAGYMLCNPGWVEVMSGAWTSLTKYRNPAIIRCARVDPIFTTPAISYIFGNCSESATSLNPYTG